MEGKESDHVTRKDAGVVVLSPLLPDHDLGRTPNRGRAVVSEEGALDLVRPDAFLLTAERNDGLRTGDAGHHHQDGFHPDEDHLRDAGKVVKI